MVLYERERKRKQEMWEIEVYDLIEKLQKKIEHMSAQLSNKLSEELGRVDENTQKRHNYLKKSFNEIADRMDIVEQTEKGVKDLYYQNERTYSKLTELVALMPKSIVPSDQDNDSSDQSPAMDEEVSKIIQLYNQGMRVEEIAQKLGRAIPEIQLTLHIFADKTNQ